MIKFLRKIRQNMIRENKVSKYLLYAVGEIVLVVIGILIALQINNWNEKRKDIDLEQKFLTNLVENLEHNCRQLESRISSISLYRKTGALIIFNIENKLSYHDSLEFR